MSYARNFGVVPAAVHGRASARLVAGMIDCIIVWYVLQAALAGFDAVRTQNALLGARDQVLFGMAALPVALLVRLSPAAQAFAVLQAGALAEARRTVVQARE